LSRNIFIINKITNSELGFRIAFVRNKLGLNQTDFAKILKLSTPGAISHWEKGLRKPDIDTLQLIAEKGEVDFYWLLTGQEYNNPNDAVNKIFNEGVKAAEFKRIKKNLSKVGLQTFRIVSSLSAGKPKEFFEDNQLGNEQDIVLPYPHKNCLVLQVKGDSMVNKISDGDLVLVDLTLPPKDGDIVATRLKSGEQFIKRMKQFNGWLMFYSENEDYPPIIKKEDDVEYYNKVVKIIKDV